MRLLIRNPYSLAGLVSALTGALLIFLGQFVVLINWVVALGIILLIMAFIFAVLGRTVPKLPPAYSRLLLETGLSNISSLVEELGIITRAVYLPVHITGGRPRALIPLHDGINPNLCGMLSRGRNTPSGSPAGICARAAAAGHRFLWLHLR